MWINKNLFRNTRLDKLLDRLISPSKLTTSPTNNCPRSAPPIVEIEMPALLVVWLLILVDHRALISGLEFWNGLSLDVGQEYWVGDGDLISVELGLRVQGEVVIVFLLLLHVFDDPDFGAAEVAEAVFEAEFELRHLLIFSFGLFWTHGKKLGVILCHFFTFGFVKTELIFVRFEGAIHNWFEILAVLLGLNVVISRHEIGLVIFDIELQICFSEHTLELVAAGTRKGQVFVVLQK